MSFSILKLNDQEYKIKFTYESIFAFEKRTGKSFFAASTDLGKSFSFSALIEILFAGLQEHHSKEFPSTESLIKQLDASKKGLANISGLTTAVTEAMSECFGSGDETGESGDTKKSQKATSKNQGN